MADGMITSSSTNDADHRKTPIRDDDDDDNDSDDCELGKVVAPSKTTAKKTVAVVHSEEQREASKDHIQGLKTDEVNVVSVSCSDGASKLRSLETAGLSSLHLIVDTQMYGILMSDGELCDDAKQPFKGPIAIPM